MHRFLSPLLLAAVFACDHGQAPPAVDGEGEVKLQAVKQKELDKALEAARGKIVVLDVWADFCVPCKKEFPNLVDLHRKFASKGVACVSVSLDPVEDQASALNFLQKQKAAFANYLLDESNDVKQKYFDIYGPPAVFVYDRDGKLAQRFDHNDINKDFTYADVEKVVKKLLEKQ